MRVTPSVAVEAEESLFTRYIHRLDVVRGGHGLVAAGNAKVTGFVGAGAQPTPLSTDEVESLLKQVDVGSSGPREQVKFIKTDNVRIIDGPFLGFNGVVDEVAQDHGRLKVLVSIFGRSTPVELGFLQVERI